MLHESREKIHEIHGLSMKVTETHKDIEQKRE